MRKSGILMHISSLPSEFGIGKLGDSAYMFANFLRDCGVQVWQILPLSPTSYGDSPYQSFSVHAGNPYFIDFQRLEKKGYLAPPDYADINWGDDPRRVDYARVYNYCFHVLRTAYSRFRKDDPGYLTFCEAQKAWLPEYALFMALKDAHEGKPWYQWEPALAQRDSKALEKAKETYADQIDFYSVLQYWFYQQWGELKTYCNLNGISIVGDIPIYVAYDSVDVWANPELFLLDKERKPIDVAGCPPDVFSPTGQLWGNPVYNWSAHARTEYRWWVARLRHALNWFDALRLDHFRGFAAYYSVPARAKNARDGCWLPGPGLSLFSALQQALGDVPLLAEDLGFLDDTVRALLSDCGFPGMQVLQFDFDSRDCGGGAVCKPNTVIYTGTHDNDTLLGWCTTAPRQDIRRACAAYGVRYPNQLPRQMMLSALRSPANTCILTVQDLLGLGSSARINTPSTVGAHNWSWRMRPGALTPGILAHLYTETCAADRAERSNICQI